MNRLEIQFLETGTLYAYRVARLIGPHTHTGELEGGGGLHDVTHFYTKSAWFISLQWKLVLQSLTWDNEWMNFDVAE